MFKIRAKYLQAVHVHIQHVHMYVHILDLLKKTKMTTLSHSNLPQKLPFSQTARADNLCPKAFVVHKLMRNRKGVQFEYSKH